MIALQFSRSWVIVLAITFCFALETRGQTLINTATPFNNLNFNNFERLGVDFGFSLQGGQGPGSNITGLLPGGNITPNLNFTQGSLGSAVPAFGNFDPNASGRFGFRNQSGGNSFGLAFDLGQGSTSTFTNTTPNVTTFNGASGSVFDASLTPFVTSFIPVLGQQNPFQNVGPHRPIYPERMNISPQMLQGFSDAELFGPRDAAGASSASGQGGSSGGSASSQVSSAALGSRSVNAIKEQRARELAVANSALRTEIDQLIIKADEAKSKGKIVLARLYYRKALQKMQGEQGFKDLSNATKLKFDEVNSKKD